MSALSEASTPAQDAATAIDTQQLHHLAQDHHQQQQHHPQQQQQQPQGPSQQPQQSQSVNGTSVSGDISRKPKAPSVRRACTACHTGKTRCSEVLPCQSCLKRGIGATCTYPDPEQTDQSHPPQTAVPATFGASALGYVHGAPTLTQHQYYDYNGAFTGASSSTFRPSKRPRNLTEEEAAAITRNFSRGDFYVGTSAPVRIDPRLPVKLTLGEGDHVHFSITETLG
ncbi:hypothetical protein CONPUDRAFT_44601 [Coniophora puteana RWD-64-598 SS2]|uniref:Zn(2)-C6 fungal-type domain-containing protein n=1 Tax=Coniophora puteana (strain RWD-64-598) TaxID=741705 RepID=A0A5M3N659_CONPW|nr:uncharacterized protein CONPUDRAFT_44601 [Coniophora puteana RWD-64-598 SS2]EIW86919.1 hypothetical protein CONPUDRAFT_44601 [Coniophora puteana RWD-64-598 SS2]